ncbi:MAG: hypothetical protein HY363_05445 [Candidatus Aenigmarchaeota archaeon]|nr:hypothetical protein [Candidatus Aenigmarchaeota archaeon]
MYHTHSYAVFESGVARYQTVNRSQDSYQSWQPALEQIVLEQPVACAVEQPKSTRNYSSLYLSPAHKEYFTAGDFLTHSQPTMFIGDAKDVEEFAKQAFDKTTGMPLPSNIIIKICSRQEMKEIHESRSGKWNESIVGFSFNGHGRHISEVFVQQGNLDSVMLTLGHELGHVISPTLQDKRDEEAKAFAFSIAWMRTIVDNNIAGLANCINPNPAKNGLHDVAFDFIAEKIKQGCQPISIFNELMTGQLSMQQKLETIGAALDFRNNLTPLLYPQELTIISDY